MYLATLRSLHGWSTAQIASAVTLCYLCSAVWVVFVGDAIERWGPRRVVLPGCYVMALGVALLTTATAPWHVFAAFVVMSFGWAGMSGAAVNAMVAPWFDAQRGLAISLALNGSSCGGGFITPLLVLMIAWLGWEAGMRWALAGMLAVMTPVLWLVLRRRPEEFGLRPDREPGERPGSRWVIVRDVRFLTIAVPFSLGLLAQVGFLTHQLSYLGPLVGARAAAFVVSATTIAAVAGRTLTGVVIDRLDRRAVSSANLLLQAAALVWLVTAESAPAIYAGCVVYGLAVGNLITLPALIVQTDFPRADFNRIVALVVGVTYCALAFGPAILGAMRDATGSYTTSFVLCAALDVIAAGLVLVRRRQSARTRRRG